MIDKIRIIALSGPSSSGKSTLARLLRRTLPSAVLLYQDDFYKPENEIPVENGIQDWDCPQAFDFDKMKEVLEHARTTGDLPSEFESKEETNELGPSRVADDVVDRMREKVAKPLANTKFIVVDGIMLYHEGSPLLDDFDIKFFLDAPYDVLKKRREARKGYATLEGFWEDPPGYFDDIVWPAYQRYYSYLFENHNVSGKLNDELVQELDLRHLVGDAGPRMPDVLEWALDIILQSVKGSC